MSQPENKSVSTVAEPTSETDGFGKADPAPEMLKQAVVLASQSGKSVAELLPSRASRGDRMRAVRAFRSALIPKNKPGRKPKGLVTAAHAAWKQGLRNVQLYSRFIPNWAKMSQWRQKAAERALMAAIHSRERRARMRNRTQSDSDQ